MKNKHLNNKDRVYLANMDVTWRCRQIKKERNSKNARKGLKQF